MLEAYRGADAEHQVQISSLKLLPPEQQDALKGLERRLVVLMSDAIAAAIPAAAAKPQLLKPLTMSLFGMLNWHYLWFRDGKGLSREAYAQMATTLMIAGAEQAIAAVDGAAEQPARAARKKSDAQVALARRA